MGYLRSILVGLGFRLSADVVLSFGDTTQGSNQEPSHNPYQALNAGCWGDANGTGVQWTRDVLELDARSI